MSRPWPMVVLGALGFLTGYFMALLIDRFSTGWYR